MTIYKKSIAFAVGSLFAGAAFAQSYDSIEQRDQREQQRIDRGIDSGQITTREADRLNGERARVERLEERARSDGRVTRNERARIDQAQDRLGRDIYRESHDRQVAGSNGSHWNRSDRSNGWGRRGDNERGRFDHGYRQEQSGQGNGNGGRGEHNGPPAGGTTTPHTGNGNSTHGSQSTPITVARQGGNGGRRTR